MSLLQWKSNAMNQKIPEIKKMVNQELVNLYASVSEDHNPLHYDPIVAKKTQFKKPIAHGMLILAFVSEAMTSVYAEQWYLTGIIDIKWKGAAIQPVLVRTDINFLKNEGNRAIYQAKCFNELDELLLEGTVSVEL